MANVKIDNNDDNIRFFYNGSTIFSRRHPRLLHKYMYMDICEGLCVFVGTKKNFLSSVTLQFQMVLPERHEIRRPGGGEQLDPVIRN